MEKSMAIDSDDDDMEFDDAKSEEEEDKEIMNTMQQSTAGVPSVRYSNMVKK